MGGTSPTQGDGVAAKVCFEEDGIQTILTFYVDGYAEGLGSSWHPNGRLARQAEIRRGKFHGSRVHWGPDGSFDGELSGFYVDGVKQD